ncbi:tripartite tricarboxylate transporter substrate binding protein [Roseomonas sp. SSH11]|uniref:Tripartite tricarboxylate transporter substrate binding protein n=1 Tax=Pararoseomonas baculiformis TaxID=2820812 RepID=A0ABS4ADU7_9PROT|nr:tripartite tricarboxylate transporter substrate binding protein [Pararoseomonas baculiformis]MBP0445046.1 tripartite tricarboxylate transporter substrate binding protein [Pararoseomonas baculiformis]
MAQAAIGRARRALLAFAASALALAPGLAAAQPQQSPVSRPVRMLVGFPPGGSTDIFARALSDELAKMWSVPVVVENRGGANGIIATEALVKSEPNGETLMFTISSHVTNRALYPNLPYNPLTDVTPIALVARSPFIVVSNPRFPARNLQDLIRLAKEKPGQIDYGSPGPGSAQQLAMELLTRTAEIRLNHVAYRGGAPAMADLMAGVIPLSLLTTTQVLAQVRAGALRPIGVTTTQRSTMLPDVPTMAEQGLQGYDADVWFGVIGPANMPPPMVQRMAADISRALSNPAVRERFTSQDAVVLNRPPEEFAQLMREEDRKWSELIRAANIRVE